MIYILVFSLTIRNHGGRQMSQKKRQIGWRFIRGKNGLGLVGRRVALGEQSVVTSVANQFVTSVKIELSHQVGAMRMHSAWADYEFLGNLFT